MINIIVQIITLLAIMLIVYHHIGYPLLLAFIARQKEHKFQQTGLTTENNRLPEIALVIPAFNEARWIADKIHNLAALDYPNDKLKIYIACDGCTDNTAEIVRNTHQHLFCQHLQLNLIEFKQNRGKVAVINQVINQIASPIVGLSDVSALLSIDALLRAAYHFADPKIGVVNSQYLLLSPNLSEQIYWRYQNSIKEQEAIVSECLGAHGALYFFRRMLFTPLDNQTINDDFVLPMRIVAAGYHAIIDTKIHAIELEPTPPANDFRRRLRISAGNTQQLLWFLPLLSPAHGMLSFTFGSGKALRVLIPFLMLWVFIASAWLAINNFFYRIVFATQLILYGYALICGYFHLNASSKILNALNYLILGHLANLIGSLKYLITRDKPEWQNKK